MKIILWAAAWVIVPLLTATPANAVGTSVERDYEIALTKGQYELEIGYYQAAAVLLEKALQLKPGDREARISLGIAYARAGDLSRARDMLRQAVDADPQDDRARYELALVLAALGRQDDAMQMMEEAIKISKDDSLVAAAQAFLRGQGAPDRTGQPSISIAGGFAYDSNVILEQDNSASPPEENKADWSSILTVDALFPFLTAENAGGELGYHFYQSLHSHLRDYNVQQHIALLTGHADLSRATRFDLAYAFLYSFVGTEHYSTAHRVSPRFAFHLAPASVTEFHGAYEWKRFFNTPVFTALTGKNGTNVSAGLTHTFLVGKRTGIAFDYTYDRDAANADYWDYTGHKVTLNAMTEEGAFKYFVGASYHDRRYGGVPPGASEKRHDGQQELTAGVSRKAGQAAMVSLTDTYTLNDSNAALYEYRRNIIGLLVEIGL